MSIHAHPSAGTTRTARLAGLLVLAAAGCGGKDQKAAELPAPWVTVAPPVEQLVTRYEFATGRVEALEEVKVEARVRGYITKINFQPGRPITKGEPMVEIDPEPYEADLAQAEGAKAKADADLEIAHAEVVRAESNILTTRQEYARQEQATTQTVGSASDRDKAKGNYDVAVATYRSSKAQVLAARAKIKEADANFRTATLNLQYCTIKAPITGIVGDKLITEGNLVGGGAGTPSVLTTVVAVDPMAVAFDVDERTVQRLQQAVRDGTLKARPTGEIPAEAGLDVQGTAYPLRGRINFADNKFDPKTGTIRMKAWFDNPVPKVGSRLLSAGMYARVRVPIGEPAKAMLVPDGAFGFDLGTRFLYLLGPDNKAVRWNATTGVLDGELRVVESIQTADERKPRPLTGADQVIVTGVQRVRPGMTVDPKPAGK